MSTSHAQDCRAVPYAAAALPWFDAMARAAESCFQAQQALWQPLLDAQAEWLRQWSTLAAWPMSQLVVQRGAEELA